MTLGGAMAVDVNAGRAFTINGFGRVGIGTDNPERELTVSGRARIWNSANTKYIEAFGGNSANFIDSYNNSLYLRYGGIQLKSIVLDSAGNVGLGGVASSKLQVGTGDADDFVKSILPRWNKP